MKYRMLKAGEFLRAGDEVSVDGFKTFGETECAGSRVAAGEVGYYRRPIPEKKARKVDWGRVTTKIMDALNKHGNTKLSLLACVGEAREIYRAAKARARKGAKGGR